MRNLAPSRVTVAPFSAIILFNVAIVKVAISIPSYSVSYLYELIIQLKIIFVYTFYKINKLLVQYLSI